MTTPQIDIRGRAADRPPGAIQEARRSIAHTLARIRRRARFWICGESLALIALVGAGYFWGSLVLDRLIEPPPATRAAGLAALLAALIVIVVRRLIGRLREPLADPQLALLVERHDPSFRDSLSTAVGAVTREPGEPVDDDLLARATAEAGDRLARVRIGALFKTASLVSVAAAALAVAGGVVWFASTAPDIASLWARRMLLMSQERWPRATRLAVEGFPDGVRRVARGSDVDVVVRADASGRVPEAVELRSRSPEGSSNERMGRRGGLAEGSQTFGHILLDVRRDLELSIRGGDDRIDGLRLAVVDPPGVESLEIRSMPPAYLGSEERVLRPSGVIEVPRGSSVRILVTADKPLSRAAIRGRPSAAGAEERTLASLMADSPSPNGTQRTPGEAAMNDRTPGEAAIGPARKLEAVIEQLEGSWTIMIDMADADGVATPRPTAFRIVGVEDAPPQMIVALAGISSAVTPRARVPVVGSIRDDHGLASAAIVVRRGRAAGGPAADAGPPAAGAVEAERTFPMTRLVPGSPLIDLPEASPESVDLEPLRLEPGEAVSVEVSAADSCAVADGANVVRSDAWTLEVVSPERLSSMLEARELILRRRFEHVVEEFAAAREPLLAADGASVGEAGAAEAEAGADAARRLADASDRCRGETTEIAAAFLEIRREFDNNRLLTDELDTRLFAQIAGPLGEIADGDLPLLAAACRRVGAAGASPAEAAAQLSAPSAAVLARLKEVLDRMLELETFNEVVEILRSAIRAQEGLREETVRRQKERARAVLEGE
jgi:hypothetical protein